MIVYTLELTAAGKPGHADCGVVKSLIWRHYPGLDVRVNWKNRIEEKK